MGSLIPTEILLKIMGYLSGKDQLKLRRVCTRFKKVVDDLNCEHWKEICIREFGDVQKYYEKSGLDWKELYKSLSLWPMVNRAKMDTYDSRDLNSFLAVSSWSDTDKRQFILLKNGLISYPQFQEYQDLCIEFGYFDLISYFDSETLCVVNQVCFDMIFDDYDENDEVIVFREQDEGKLMIVPKTSDNRQWEPILIDKLKEDEYDMSTDFYLAKNSNDVYYFVQNTLWKAKLVDVNGLYNIEKYELGQFNHTIVCISKLNETKAIMLTKTNGGEIYYIIDNIIEYRDKIDTRAQPNTVIQQLKEHSLDWMCINIYKWLDEDCGVVFSKLKKSIIYQHGNNIILGTKNRILHVYHNPYKNGQLNLNSARPNVKIDLNIFHPLHEKAIHKDINQIDVVEIPNGHRIILVYGNKLVAVELIHTQYMKRSLEVIIKERRIKRHKIRGSDFDDYEDPYLDTPI